MSLTEVRESFPQDSHPDATGAPLCLTSISLDPSAYDRGQGGMDFCLCKLWAMKHFKAHERRQWRKKEGWGVWGEKNWTPLFVMATWHHYILKSNPQMQPPPSRCFFVFIFFNIKHLFFIFSVLPSGGSCVDLTNAWKLSTLYSSLLSQLLLTS